MYKNIIIHVIIQYYKIQIHISSMNFYYRQSWAPAEIIPHEDKKGFLHREKKQEKCPHMMRKTPQMMKKAPHKEKNVAKKPSYGEKVAKSPLYYTRGGGPPNPANIDNRIYIEHNYRYTDKIQIIMCKKYFYVYKPDIKQCQSTVDLHAVHRSQHHGRVRVTHAHYADQGCHMISSLVKFLSLSVEPYNVFLKRASKFTMLLQHTFRQHWATLAILTHYDSTNNSLTSRLNTMNTGIIIFLN